MATSPFQEMILFPEKATAQMESTVISSKSYEARFHHEMQNILQRTDVILQKKWKIYLQTFHSYFHHTPQANKPIILLLLDSDPSAGTASTNPLFQLIFHSVPRT